MYTEQQKRLGWRGLAISIPWVLPVVIMLAGLAGGRGEGTGRASSVPVMPAPVVERTLPARLGAIDDAIGRKDVSQAVIEWRDAYGVALRSRQWDAMTAVGDAAVRIDGIARQPSGYPTGFRAEARQAYLRALVDARAARSREGIERVAEAFAALGDAEMAARVRTLAAAQ
jgi:hypothetical protein